jgi:hypothetical protein
MNEDVNTTIQWLLWQLQYINGEHTIQAKNLENAMATTNDDTSSSTLQKDEISPLEMKLQ